MTTYWVSPNHVVQFSEPEAEQVDVAWDDANQFKQIITKDKRSLSTAGLLKHIARSPKNDIKNKTYNLRATGFKFQNVPSTISGIAVRINVQRFGRAMDDLVQLSLNGKEIGNNQADMELLPEKIYGSSSDLWGLDAILKQDIEDESFGVTVRYKAHPNWPHASSVLIDSIEMRIY